MRVDARRQLVHAPIDQTDQAAEQVGAAMERHLFGGAGRLGFGRRGEAHYGQVGRQNGCRNGCDLLGSNHARFGYGV